ncbi:MULTISPECIES: tetratricopeptide repeat protein [Niastella]|uniref:Tetratricopeptide repeat protein n=1 Tax=Niastella soli TaxID=2821487 RepID=A0ABS3YV50_9BACT|nr:tetratricopeptide repeat protein [Niastella soli]MBO9201809.1 tetratricopeptide repeat protein [Niastella soli]
MATEVKQVPEQPVERSTEEKVVDSARDFWGKNNKVITYALAGLVVIVGGYFAYTKFYKGPAEAKAADAIWKAEDYYRLDSFKLALEGDGMNGGFLKAIKNHGGTKAGNLAQFYAGACYMQLGDFNNAIKYLKEFSTSQVEMEVRAAGLLGDAYSELGKKQEAVDYYKKAGNLFDKDDINSPEYLFRAAMLYQDLGKNKEAIEVLHQIKDKYPSSQRAFEVDKYLGKLGDLN